jgi:hypothetical protein
MSPVGTTTKETTMTGRRTPARSRLVLGALLAATGLILQAPPSTAAGTSQVRPAPTSDARGVKTEALKRVIVLIAERARGRCDEDDNNPVVGQVLNLLTDKLVRAAPARTEFEKLPQVAGGWKQVWSNLEATPGGPPRCTAADGIYQVVSPDSYYWNISRSVQPGGPPGLGLLRGKYQTTPDFLRIEFTDLAVSPVVPPAGTNLVDLANRAENGEFIALPPGPPVGVSGELRNAFVDDEVRIVRGSDDRPGSPASIFVLVRADVLG